MSDEHETLFPPLVSDTVEAAFNKPFPNLILGYTQEQESQIKHSERLYDQVKPPKYSIIFPPDRLIKDGKEIFEKVKDSLKKVSRLPVLRNNKMYNESDVEYNALQMVTGILDVVFVALSKIDSEFEPYEFHSNGKPHVKNTFCDHVFHYGEKVQEERPPQSQQKESEEVEYAEKVHFALDYKGFGKIVPRQFYDTVDRAFINELGNDTNTAVVQEIYKIVDERDRGRVIKEKSVHDGKGQSRYDEKSIAARMTRQQILHGHAMDCTRTALFDGRTFVLTRFPELDSKKSISKCAGEYAEHCIIVAPENHQFMFALLGFVVEAWRVKRARLQSQLERPEGEESTAHTSDSDSGPGTAGATHTMVLRSKK
ncbi:hypothetical protein F5Y18DRAFT_392325 [Xylariaceae sp. FL1019]|nr:hypothetical protein F5Y18DRAFT_392325 [Xylariaceae sp. FL1019]